MKSNLLSKYFVIDIHPWPDEENKKMELKRWEKGCRKKKLKSLCIVKCQRQKLISLTVIMAKVSITQIKKGEFVKIPDLN